MLHAKLLRALMLNSPMSDSLKEAIGAALQKKSASLDDFVAILRQFRDRGMTADSAYAALESLRGAGADSTEDLILEIMDIVSGFCAPHLRVWDE
jgi:hypothetical protein